MSNKKNIFEQKKQILSNEKFSIGRGWSKKSKFRQIFQKNILFDLL